MKAYPFYQAFDLPHITEEVLAKWEKNNTFLQSIAQRKGAPAFVLYEGPPSANGVPGIHHVLSRTLKDLFGRYKTMQGYSVERKSGWDTHGLPIELQVEKELGITKKDIGQKISIAAYNDHCRKAVMRYQKEWEKLTKKIGYWVDLKHPYKTCTNDYILSVWSLLKKLYTKKLLYKGYSIQPYSPAAGTGLSTHELTQPGCYKMVKDISVTAQLRIKHMSDTYLLAWTTTPWTLPANSALAINKNATYVKVSTYNRFTQCPIHVVLAEKCLSNYFQENMKEAEMVPPASVQAPLPWKIIDRYPGTRMLGWEYEQLLAYVQPSKPAFRIVHADFATLEGTGIIHIAPTFGKEDYYLAQKEGIPPITVQNAKGEELPIVDKQGRFIEAITDFAGCYVKEAYTPASLRQKTGYLPTDVRIVQKLKKENKVFYSTKHTHSYPHCWRTDKPIIYYPLTAWFVKTTAVKKRLVELNKTIHWYPSSTGTGRFGEWLHNVVDWNLSRSRFWGTPLPIWRTPDGSEEKCIGSIAQLMEEVNRAVDAGIMPAPITEQIDLHRPYVDHIVLLSSKGKKMYREPDVIDVWFDAGAMPYAQHGPLQHHAPTLPPKFPADFIAEGIDQTRGWFFTLHVLATMLHDAVAFKNVLATGLLLDREGNKMSKRLGNAIDPFALMCEHGADVIRWYMISNAHPWDNLKFDTQGLKEVRNRFFGTLYNTYQFFALYANLDNFVAGSDYPPIHHCRQIDIWILSKLQGLITCVTQHYDKYNPTKATRAIQEFVIEDLSNWYIRLNRKRFWQAEKSMDKTTAYQIVHICLKTIAELAAPVAPFYMERLYQDIHPLEETVSVHLADFPQSHPAYLYPQLEEQIAVAQNITSLVHRLRKQHNLKVRQPLALLSIVPKEAGQLAYIQKSESMICKEVNIKKIAYPSDLSSMIVWKIKPNLKTLGKTYGPLLPTISKALSQLTQHEISDFQQQGHYELDLADLSVRLTIQDVIIDMQCTEGNAIASTPSLTIALDLGITPSLQAEGWSRELVNRIQHLRKDQGLEVTQKIDLQLATPDPQFQEALTSYENYIAQETQALQVTWSDHLENATLILLDTRKIYIILVPIDD